MKNKLIDMLTKMNIDAYGTIEGSFMSDADTYVECVFEFMDDPSMKKLAEAVAARDASAAMNAVFTLNGLAESLGFSEMHNAAYAMHTAFRRGHEEEAFTLLQPVQISYDKLAAVIWQFRRDASPEVGGNGEPVRHTMLVVDDTKMNRMMLQRIFRDEYNILMAENGIQAMEILRQQKVDVVILDIIMPDMDGYEVITAIRSDETLKEIPIVITTAERERSERKALELGADDFITKPYDSIVVEKRVNNITQKYILQQEKLDILLREHALRTEALTRQAERDPLTGVYNRMGFRRQVKEILEESPVDSALFIIDIDLFKLVNDKYGHPTGDMVLQRLARCFLDHTRPGDVISRIGGDEFAIYLRCIESRRNAMEKANELIAHASRVRREIGLTENHSISVGIAYASTAGLELDALYQTADHALYIAKENGRGRFAMMERAVLDGGAYVDIFCPRARYADGAAPRAAVITPERPTVLVLDRDEASREKLVTSLSQKFAPATANDMDEAFRTLRSAGAPVSAVLMQADEADAGAIGFLQRLNMDEALCGTPVVVLSTSDGKAWEAKLFANGAICVLVRERRMGTVVRTVEEILRGGGRTLR